jgi:hypothetical protein
LHRVKRSYTLSQKIEWIESNQPTL